MDPGMLGISPGCRAVTAGFSTRCCSVPSDLRSVPSVNCRSRGIPPHSAWEGPGSRQEVEGQGDGEGCPGV